MWLPRAVSGRIGSVHLNELEVSPSLSCKFGRCCYYCLSLNLMVSFIHYYGFCYYHIIAIMICSERIHSAWASKKSLRHHPVTSTTFSDRKHDHRPIYRLFQDFYIIRSHFSYERVTVAGAVGAAVQNTLYSNDTIVFFFAPNYNNKMTGRRRRRKIKRNTNNLRFQFYFRAHRRTMRTQFELLLLRIRRVRTWLAHYGYILRAFPFHLIASAHCYSFLHSTISY